MKDITPIQITVVNIMQPLKYPEKIRWISLNFKGT